MKKYVWYASYGSNISTERFLCYIKGGKAIGAETSELGCRDQSMPLMMENIIINKQQYFAKSSKRWQERGVAFIDDITSDERTLGRMYLITSEQFEDVVKQENHMHVEESLDVRLHEAAKNGSAIVIPGSWYGRIVYLGEKQGYPIYTFTNTTDLAMEVFKAPSKEYLQMIGSGLKENYGMDKEALSIYFMHKSGVQPDYDLDKLNKIFENLYK